MSQSLPLANIAAYKDLQPVQSTGALYLGGLQDKVTCGERHVG